jgi:hypothetical protein
MGTKPLIILPRFIFVDYTELNYIINRCRFIMSQARHVQGKKNCIFKHATGNANFTVSVLVNLYSGLHIIEVDPNVLPNNIN